MFAGVAGNGAAESPVDVANVVTNDVQKPSKSQLIVQMAYIHIVQLLTGSQ